MLARCGHLRCAIASALLGAALFVVIVATAYGQIRLNDWNQPFYDALRAAIFASSCTSSACSG